MPAQSDLSMFDLPLLGRGFRPFFLLAAGYGALGLVAWVGVLFGWWTPAGALEDPALWHAHEMIYGFVMAVVAGFLLTAVANWTGGAPVRQLQLVGLCLLWLAGRVAMFLDTLPLWLVAVVDNAFIPALAISLALPLFKSRNTRNFIFLGILTVLLACNVSFYILQDRLPLHVALLTVLTMISLVSSRIVPAFTVAGLRRMGILVYQKEQPLLDKLCLFSMVTLIATFGFMGPVSSVTGNVAFFAGICHLLRFRHYHTLKSLKDPMLWILHGGYAWLFLGLFLLGLCGFGVGTLSLALHALTVGSIGSMCIGMMCRVTLGHTGRNLIARPSTIMIFVMMQLAALLRVGGAFLLPEYYLAWIGVSGALWAACFAVYLSTYATMLVKPRPDGMTA
jgi:uncharacterized protein involved in response to NO